MANLFPSKNVSGVFAQGGSEVFGKSFYWTSTEFNASGAYMIRVSDSLVLNAEVKSSSTVYHRPIRRVAKGS
uniref:Uncharacterized protein n=1 Tax=viral metagenome TaxID=1070528 RepID=A0A6M3M1P9_9ZZZZ